ncbi:MAG: polysaccharide deacetylase family protein, partial [Deltaproteobacteria bacterium]
MLPTPDALFPDVPDAVRFDRILEWISTWFNVLPLREAVRGLGAGTLPARAASLTFDDGYEDNVSVALPILARRGFTATFFIATGYLDGGCMWNDRIITAIRECRRDMLDLTDLDLERHPLESWSARRRAIETIIERSKYRDTAERERLADRVLEAAGAQAPTRIMMTTSGVRMLRASGMEIGAHTVSHPILSRLALEDARREIAESKETLENLIQEPVELFAYPNGRPGVDYLAAHTRLPHEAGFVAAVSTGWGTAHRTSDTMQLPRFTPWDRTRGRFALRLLQNLARRGDVVPTEATLSKRT